MAGASKTAKKPKANSIAAYGILNPWGDVWTPRFFNTPVQALAYLNNSDVSDQRGYRIVRVRVRTSYIGETERSP